MFASMMTSFEGNEITAALASNGKTGKSRRRGNPDMGKNRKRGDADLRNDPEETHSRAILIDSRSSCLLILCIG